MNRLAIIASTTFLVMASISGVGTASAGKLSGDIASFSPASPSYGDSVSFETSIDGRVSSRQKAELSAACVADGVMVLQGAVKPDQPIVLASNVWNGGPARCFVTLRVVDMYKSGVYVLDSVEFDVTS